MKESAAYQAASAAQSVESGGTVNLLRPASSAARKSTAAQGLEFPRFFTEAGVDPFDEVEWEIRSALIGNERGEMVFEQRDVEIPKAWSQQATNIVVSKYFRGQIGTPEREHSVKAAHHWPCRRHDHRVGKIPTSISRGDADLQAFSDDLKHILVYQKAAFNSPVWFNCTASRRRRSARRCFINSVQDTMDSILTLARTEGMLFKDSRIRHEHEPVADPVVA